jgi:hypothetical protein
VRIHDRPFHFSSMAIVESEARDELQPFQPNGGVSTPANASDPGAGAGAGEAIRQLKFEQASLARREKELSKQIRNETRKRSRLRERARKLSNDDLLKVLYSRQQAAEVKGRAKSTRKS